MCSIYNTSSGCFSTVSSYFMFTSSMKSKLAAGPSTWGWHEVRIGQVPLLRIILHSWQEVWEGQNLHQHRMREQNWGQWMHERLPQTVDIWQTTAIIGWGDSENTPFLENNGNHVGGSWNFCALLASVCFASIERMGRQMTSVYQCHGLLVFVSALEQVDPINQLIVDFVLGGLISQLELRWRNAKECNDQGMRIYWEMI